MDFDTITLLAVCVMETDNNLLAELSNLGVVYIRREKWPEHGSPRISRGRPSSPQAHNRFPAFKNEWVSEPSEKSSLQALFPFPKQQT